MKRLVLIFRTLVAALIVFLFHSNTLAQSCGCDHTFTGLKTTSVNIIDAASFNYQPGDVFCINAGTYAELRFSNFQGTAAQPLIFKNCGGQVKIDGITYPGIQFRNSKHIQLTGTGNTNFEYGIHILKAKDGVSGVSIQELSTDFEVDHLEISNVGFAGIIAKTDPDCARPETWRGTFLMKNLKFHDNYIHQIGGEGFYVGGTFGYETSKKICSGVETFAHLLENVVITNNIIEDTGWDGLQLNLTVANAEVSNNTIYGYGWKKEFAQNQGISLGSSKVKMFNNKVIQKPEYAVPDSYGISMVSPFPGSYIFNNVVVASGDYGIWTHVRTPTALLTPFGTDAVYYINNTVVNAGASGFFYNSREGTDPRGSLPHVFYNNLIVDPKTVYTNGTFWKKSTEAFIDYNDKDQKDGATLDKNLLSRTTPIVPASEVTRSSLKFSNSAGNDFSLLAGSAAIGVGRDVTSLGVTFDYNNGSRPIGGTFDAGAYEFGATNLSPTAKAGSDIVIEIDQTATLNGSGSTDSDGTIAQYLWTKVSGPSSPAITNSNAAQASITISVAGVYVYKLTVTDNEGATASDQVQIVVGNVNQPPVANAGPDVAIAVGQVAALNGSGSTDPDGTIAQYLWTKVSGPSSPTITGASTAQASLTINTAGVYIYRLTVTDNGGDTSFDEVKIDVGAANQSPLAKAGSDFTIEANQPATLNGSSSSDPDGTIAQYQWTKVSGPSSPTITNANAAQASITFTTGGVYVYKLTVTDNKGATASDNIQIIVSSVITGILNSRSNNENLVDIYPNPVKAGEKAVVTFNLVKPSDVYMELYSSSGSLLSQLPKVNQANSETKVDVDLKGLAVSNNLVLLIIRTNVGFAIKRLVIN